MINILGVFLTPILLLSLACLFFFGFVQSSSLSETLTLNNSESFLHGLVVGYNTMDLIAAFLFATVVLPHFQKEIALECPKDKKKALSKKILVTSLIAGTHLLFTYIGLAFIAAHHGPAETGATARGRLARRPQRGER